MKKFICGVVLGFLASVALAFASGDITHNGAFWNKLNVSAKDGYVNGYSDAMRVSAAKIDELNVAADIFHWKGARKIIQQLTDQLSTNELTPQQAVTRLDSLYANQKYSELDLGEALQTLTVQAKSTALPPDQSKDNK
jgi:hypothetical protein